MRLTALTSLRQPNARVATVWFMAGPCCLPSNVADRTYLVSIGTMDTILCHSREVFRLAIVASASAIIIAHNHPSGESTPSEADIKITHDLIRAGQFLEIEVLDHIVIGKPNHSLLRSWGYFSKIPPHSPGGFSADQKS